MIGSTGLIGSAVAARFAAGGARVLGLSSSTYQEAVGREAGVVVNCNGNAVRFKANEDPSWDFDASVRTVQRSLFDFHFDRYVYISTVDVYGRVDDRALNNEESVVDPWALAPYPFHKWLAEQVVHRYAPRRIILRVGSVVGPGLRKNPIYDLVSGVSLFSSLDSTLSLIDTETIAEAVERTLADNSPYEVYNVTGAGGARIGDLADEFGLHPTLAAGATDVVHRYDIDVRRLGTLMSVPDSMTVARRFVAATLEAAERPGARGQGPGARPQ